VRQDEAKYVLQHLGVGALEIALGVRAMSAIQVRKRAPKPAVQFPPATSAIGLPADLQLLREGLPPLLIMEEVAALYRVSPASIDRWIINDDQFPAPIKVGGAIKRFPRDSVLLHLASGRSREPLAARTRKMSRRKKGRATK
jgi:predicted DNA-binding transcriptional regulator AlpA